MRPWNRDLHVVPKFKGMNAEEAAGSVLRNAPVPPVWGVFPPIYVALITSVSSGAWQVGSRVLGGRIFLPPASWGHAFDPTTPLFVTPDDEEVVIYVPAIGPNCNLGAGTATPKFRPYDAENGIEDWIAVYPAPGQGATLISSYSIPRDGGDGQITGDGIQTHWTWTGTGKMEVLPLTLRITYVDNSGMTRWIWTDTSSGDIADNLNTVFAGDGSGWYKYCTDAMDLTFAYPPAVGTIPTMWYVDAGISQWIGLPTLQDVEGGTQVTPTETYGNGHILVDASGRLAHGDVQAIARSIALPGGGTLNLDARSHVVSVT